MRDNKGHGWEYFVSPDGNDAWSGRLPEPNAKKTDGPWATLPGARDALRALHAKRQDKAPVTIRMRGGTYRLSEPLVLTPQDSGTADAPVTWCAFPGETPVLTGLRPLAGRWERHEGAVGKMRLPENPLGWGLLRQLFVNGRRLERARWPKTGWFDVYQTPGETDDERKRFFRYLRGDVRRWSRMSEVEFVVLHQWSESRLFVESLDEARDLVRFTGSAAYEFFGAKYWVENVMEALTEPGTWVFDSQAGTVYTIPPEGVCLENAQAEVPAAKQLLRVERAGGQVAGHLRFEGLTFNGTGYEILPAGYANGGGTTGPHHRPAALEFQGAEDCCLTHCDLVNMATYSVDLSECKRCVVEHCAIREAGGGGVIILQGEDNAVRHCHIHHCGRIFLGGTGVVNADGLRTHIAHNLVHDMPYCGIRGGNPTEFGGPATLGEIIEFNHVHHVMLVLDDGAGIFNAGSGSVISNNLVHDVVGGKCRVAHGLYLDEFRTGVRMENNVCYNTGAEVMHLHTNYGNTIVNNIWANGGKAQLSWTVFHGIHFGKRLAKWRPPLQTFQRNIVYWKDGCLSHNLDCNRWDLTAKPEMIDYNLYWNAAPGHAVRLGLGGMGKPGVDSLADWQEMGLDAHSIVADPLFIDPDHGDFRLCEGSPALKLGFVPIDLSAVGPRPARDGN